MFLVADLVSFNDSKVTVRVMQDNSHSIFIYLAKFLRNFPLHCSRLSRRNQKSLAQHNSKFFIFSKSLRQYEELHNTKQKAA